jgi:hypothetical protein
MLISPNTKLLIKKYNRLVVLLVRETGLEPARPYDHKYLKLARLPIPPFPQGEIYLTIMLVLLQEIFYNFSRVCTNRFLDQEANA